LRGGVQELLVDLQLDIIEAIGVSVLELDLQHACLSVIADGVDEGRMDVDMSHRGFLLTGASGYAGTGIVTHPPAREGRAPTRGGRTHPGTIATGLRIFEPALPLPP
jgi:hypothetical protein